MGRAQTNTLGDRGAMNLCADGVARVEGPFPLSCAQESLWFVEQMFPGSPAYNIPEAWRIRGHLDASALQRSIDEVVRRHEVLRTFFRSEKGKPAQFISASCRLELEQIDLTDDPLAEEKLRAELDRAARKPFDLGCAPLARFVLFRLGPAGSVLLVNVHHIISDAWSQGLLMRELAHGYIALIRGEAYSPDPPAIQYADFASWQSEMVESELGRRHLDYWREYLQNLPSPAGLPLDHLRRAPRSSRGQTHFFYFPEGLVARLRELGREQGTTLYMTLLAGLNVLLYRYSREPEIVIGSPMACRERLEVESLLGLFVNTHALRTDLSGNPTFRELLGRVREGVLGACAHQEFPGELLLKHLALDRSAGGHPLFNVVFGWQNVPPQDWAGSGLELSRIDLETGTAKFDWTILASETPQGLQLRCEFSTDLFHPATMSRALEHFQALLEAAVESPGSRVSELRMLTPAEKQQVLIWGQPTSDYERGSTIQELFEAQARRFSERIALAWNGGSLTYSELDGRSNRLARRLIEFGVKAGDNVAFCLGRSAESVCTLLAILKAGAAYVPLDPDYPAERLAFMLQDSASSAVVTDEDHAPGLKPVVGSERLLVLNAEAFLEGAAEHLALNNRPTDPAYVVYTSGSTGSPKGTVVPHRAVIRLVRNTNYLAFSEDLVFLQSSPITFDAATFEIWGALLNGAKLVIPAGGALSLQQFGREIRGHGVTTLWLTSGLFDQMVDQQLEDLRGLKHLLAGGDVLSAAHVSKAVQNLPDCQVINGYGPTENTTFTACFPVPADWPADQPVPIGRPVSNTSVYVVDRGTELAPIGVTGELYTGGDGVCLGYLGESTAIAGKFILDRFGTQKSGRLYKTGDLARWRADGNLEFLGRIDSQVKIRGHRIEPGEVENLLCRHPEVSAAAVIVCEDKFTGKHLVAYVAGKNPPASGALREFIASKVPAYMVPSRIIVLDQLPLTANGKVDKRALSKLQPETPVSAEPAGPVTPTQKAIAEIWCELLGRSHVGIDEDFFLLGGHSLIATQMISRLARAFNVELPLRALFEKRTVAQLGEVVEQSRQAGSSSISPITRAVGGRAGQLLEHLDDLTEQEIEALLEDPDLKIAL